MNTATHLRRIAVGIIIGTLGAVFAFAGGASAVTTTTQSFQISPPTSNYAGDPGAAVRGTIKVTNLTGDPISLRVGKQNFVAKGEEGEIELTDDANPLYSLAPWFVVPSGTVDVPPRGTKEVSYTISIPANAEPGGRYGSIIFSTIPPRLPSGVSGATVQQNLAGIVFARINGQANEKLEVASFKAGKSFSEYGPTTLDTRVKNVGNVHEKPVGTITIKNMFGMKVETIKLDEHFVIPGSIRHLKNEWPVKGKSHILLGRYTAEMTASYGGGQTISATTSFTVFPWKIALIILAVLIVLFLFFWKGRKRLARAGRILAGRE